MHDLHPSLTNIRNTEFTSTKAHYNIIEPDEDRNEMPAGRTITPPRCSTWIMHTQFPGNISCQAIHHIMTLEAKKSAAESQRTGPIIDIEEYCYGILHPVTKQTITQYCKLMNDTHLKDLWVPAMSKEVH
jgi:hypothetical protein